jgi:PAS domain S-box-containing protein
MDVAFPFYFALDPDLRIVQQGIGFQKHLPLLGQTFADAFLVEAPRVSLTPADLLQHHHSIFLLRSRRSQMLLRGQLVSAEEPGYTLFLGSPSVTSLDELLDLGLALADFAIHDVVADFTVVMQAKNNTIQESQELADDLARQRAELRSANLQLQVQRQVDLVLNGAGDLTSILGDLLPAIGKPLGWTRGAAWDLSENPPRRLQTWGNVTALEPSPLVFQEGSQAWWEPSPRHPDHLTRMALRLPAGRLVLEWATEIPVACDPNYAQLFQEITQVIGQAVNRWAVDRQLRETESRRAAIMFASLDAIITTDHQWRITELNPSAERLFGWSLTTLLGQRVDEALIAPNRRSALPTEYPQQRFEILVRCENNTEVPVEVAVVPIRDSPGGGHIIFLRDLTQSKKSESALRHAVRTAEAANKAKSEFLAQFSHELRTPMNGILGMSEIAQDSTSFSEIRECLTRIQSNGETMREHISGILDFSKIEAGEMDMEERVFDVVDLVEGVVGNLATRADQKDMDLYSLIDPVVPRLIWGDNLRLQQVLINLVGNAIKFTDKGEVRVELTAENGQLHLSVYDTGIGLSPSELQNISQKFWRSERVKGYVGTGLGLAITRSIVDRMHGRIEIESVLGKGTCFHVWLPMKAEPSVPLPPLPEPAPIVQVQLQHGPTSDCILRLLRARGFTAYTESGSVLPDVLICDVNSPSRLEHALEIQSQGTRVLGVSTLGRGLPGREMLDGVLHKPFRSQRLMHRVEQLLGLIAADSDSDATAFPLRPYRLLVAEDNGDNQRYFRHALKQAGYDVDVASNGIEAAALAAEYSYALILMDVEMPELDGFGATKRIRQNEMENGRVRTPIVALTAHAIEEFRQRCLDAGMDDYATKPIQRRRLLELASRWINTRPLVLRVDDAPDGREVFRRFLEKDGRVRVVTAPDGFQALQLFGQHRVDAVVVDLEMPKMDGLTLISALRQNLQTQIPIVALTGHTDADTRRRCEEAGCVGYLVKPASKTEIIETMHRVLFPQEHRSSYVSTLS